MTSTELETETATEIQNPEDRFLAFLLLLGQQEDNPVNLPALEDALLTAQVLRRCVADGHMAGTERWSVLDVAAHIGLCTGKGRMPAERVRTGLMQAHAEFLRGAGSVRTSSCTHCDALPPIEPELSLEAAAAFERALQAEPKLRAVSQLVDVLRLLVRPTDEMCHGCVWEALVKPLVRPWIGWGRGYLPKPAKDPDPDEDFPRFVKVDLGSDWQPDPRIPAETETEKWLRSCEAWNAVTEVLANLDRCTAGRIFCPTDKGGNRQAAMRRLLCWFRGHQWHIEENYATQGTEQKCVRCGAYRSTFPGDPEFRPRRRPPPSTWG